MARCDIWLRYDPKMQLWQLAWTSADGDDHRLYQSEDTARGWMDALKSDPAVVGTWKLIDSAERRAQRS
jgi:hypothetical protein